jgi:regulatory protein
MDLRTAIYRYCNYQERSHQEVRDKLYGLGANTEEVNNLIAELIEENLLNEERFARALVRGKFNQKHWGRVKIIQQLKQQRISPYLIKKALLEIEPNAYFETASRLAEKKWAGLQAERNSFQKQGKVYRYLLQKGYESSIINEVISALLSME